MRDTPIVKWLSEPIDITTRILYTFRLVQIWGLSLICIAAVSPSNWNLLLVQSGVAYQWGHTRCLTDRNNDVLVRSSLLSTRTVIQFILLDNDSVLNYYTQFTLKQMNKMLVNQGLYILITRIFQIIIKDIIIYHIMMITSSFFCMNIKRKYKYLKCVG